MHPNIFMVMMMMTTQEVNLTSVTRWEILKILGNTPAKFNSSPLKNAAWKHPFGKVILQGRTVKLRGISWIPLVAVWPP